MTWLSRYGWKFVGRAAVVIGLVFAALVSSWVGIEVERHGKEAVTEASLEGRDRTVAVPREAAVA